MFSQSSLCLLSFLCFVSGLVFPVGGLLLKFDDFPLVWNILSPPQLLFGFYSIHCLSNSLDNRESRANHSN